MKMDPLKMYFLLNMGIFHCYVSLPEGISYILQIVKFFLFFCEVTRTFSETVMKTQKRIRGFSRTEKNARCTQEIVQPGIVKMALELIEQNPPLGGVTSVNGFNTSILSEFAKLIRMLICFAIWKKMCLLFFFCNMFWLHMYIIPSHQYALWFWFTLLNDATRISSVRSWRNPPPVSQC